MKDISISKQFEYLGEHYRFTRYIGSEILEVEILEKRRLYKDRWSRIYFGHLEPLKEALRLFNQ